MRLGNLDAVKEEIIQYFNDVMDINEIKTINTVISIIDNAPTVELTEEKAIDKLYETGWIIRHDNEMTERPQGEWIKEDDEHLKGWYRCSECGRRVEDLTNDVVIHAGCEDYTIADIYPFCHCGAEMKGEENE